MLKNLLSKKFILQNYRPILEPQNSLKNKFCLHLIRNNNIPRNQRSLRSVRQFTQHNNNREPNPDDYDDESKKKRTPKVYYFHNPWNYFKMKYQMFLLKILWDRKFSQGEFIRGSKQAAIIITDIIRNQKIDQIVKFTTPSGFHQIRKDMALSRNDPRLQMVNFRVSDIKKIVPVRVTRIKHQGQRHCVIDMFYVGVRNINDFDLKQDNDNIAELFQKFINFKKKQYAGSTLAEKLNTYEMLLDDDDMFRVIFAEIFIRFYREYTDVDNLENWNVMFYKIVKFDIVTVRN